MYGLVTHRAVFDPAIQLLAERPGHVGVAGVQQAPLRLVPFYGRLPGHFLGFVEFRS